MKITVSVSVTEDSNYTTVTLVRSDQVQEVDRDFRKASATLRQMSDDVIERAEGRLNQLRRDDEKKAREAESEEQHG